MSKIWGTVQSESEGKIMIEILEAQICELEKKRDLIFQEINENAMKREALAKDIETLKEEKMMEPRK